ncbi:hypothetical protein, partial [Vibrio sp. V39_P1S14PM300]|uniref:hypothetical protein n=1 Tax=Vibrio sp. V39_P1S14PM300 TaxID=1938690 RepID=UPI00137310E0
MGKWNELTETTNLSRHGKSYDGKHWGEPKKFSENWTPICEMFDKKIYSHPWIKNSTNKNLSVKTLTPHHLISVSSLH